MAQNAVDFTEDCRSVSPFLAFKPHLEPRVTQIEFWDEIIACPKYCRPNHGDMDWAGSRLYGSHNWVTRRYLTPSCIGTAAACMMHPTACWKVWRRAQKNSVGLPDWYHPLRCDVVQQMSSTITTIAVGISETTQHRRAECEWVCRSIATAAGGTTQVAGRRIYAC